MNSRFDEEYVLESYEMGRRNITDGRLINSYMFITGKRPTSSCTACFRRTAWAEVSKFAVNYRNSKKIKV